MVVTFNHELPTIEELTVEEVPISTPGLRAAAHHLGKASRFKLFSHLNDIVLYAHRKILSGR